jgi:O-antigen ligase
MIKQFALVCLVLSWIVPLHFLPWVSWHNEVLAFFSALFLACTLLVTDIKKTRYATLTLPITVLFFMAFATVAAIQAASGLITFAGDAAVVGFYVVLCCICVTMGYISGTQSVSEKSTLSKLTGHSANSDVTLLAVGLLIGAVMSAVVAFAQVFDLWEEVNWIVRMPVTRRPGGNLGQPNQLATLLIMGIASLLFLYESRKLSAVPAAALLFPLVAAVAASESRAGFLSFFALVFWFFAKRSRVKFTFTGGAVAAVTAGFMTLFLVWPLFITTIQVLESGAVVNVQPGTRFIVWPQLIEALSLKPWWGWGIGRVSEAQNAVAHLYPTGEAFTYSHNIVLDLALGVGAPLTVLIVAASGVWVYRRAQVANHLLSWYCVAACLPLAVHSMLEFPFAYAYFLVPALFLLGVLDGLTAVRALLHLRVASLAAFLLIPSAFMAWSVIEYLTIEEDFRVVRFEGLRIGKAPENYEKPNILVLTQLDALLKGGRIVPKPGMSFEEIELAKSVALRFPWTATQNRYALSLALNGHPSEAVRQMQVIRALHGESTYQEIRLSWAKQAKDKYPQLANILLLTDLSDGE